MQVDPHLVEAARNGDREAFAALMRETQRAVYTVVFRIVGNAEDAADVTQEVYLRVWRGLKRFRGDSSFTTWLHRIATNTALSHVRRDRGAAVPLLEETLGALEPSKDETDERADADLVERALARLPASQRAAVVLKDVYGWSMEEIAKEMGVTEGAAKLRVFRARQRLADELARGGVVIPFRRRDSR